MRQAMPADAVLINANENPLGPCKAACEAIASIAPKGGRYDIDGETDKLIKTFASQNGLKENYIAVYAGSSEPLHYSVLAFTSPTKGFVTADPSYEAGMRAAQVAKAKISKVPLKPDYSHDVKAMIAADPNAGVFVWETRRPGIKVIATHRVEPVRGGGVRLTLVLEYKGILGPFMAIQLKNLNWEYLTKEAQGLKAHCEQSPNFPT